MRPWCRLAEHVADTEKFLHTGRGVACDFMRCLSTDLVGCERARSEEDARDGGDMVDCREQVPNADLHAYERPVSAHVISLADDVIPQ